jgi:alpha-ribazole phosphatase/probable phosphoglycerate mutase
MSLVFIRHAETDLAGTFCGHADPPLNARGHAQAAHLAQQLAAQPFDAVYSSDLQRAVQTAAVFNLPITTNPALREIHFGDWESLTWPQIEARDPLYARRWADSFPHLPAPNGETFAHFESRVLNELSVILRACNFFSFRSAGRVPGERSLLAGVQAEESASVVARFPPVILSEVRHQPDAAEGPARLDAPERPPEPFSHPLSHQPHTAIVTHAGVLRIILRELFGHTDAQAWAATKPYCCTFPYPDDDRLKLNSSPTAASAAIHVTMEEHTGATP